MSQVAPAAMHQQSALAVHQPGSPVLTRTHFAGVAAWLHTPLATWPRRASLLMRPILSAPSTASEMFLWGPAVIPATWVFRVGMGYSEMPPLGVHRPIALNAPGSLNHRLPSDPAAIAKGRAPDGMPNSVIMPMGVTRAMLWASCSTNHTLPSGPAVVALGKLAGVGRAYGVIMPFGVVRPVIV